MTDIITFLSNKLGRYKAHSNNEFYFACPFCHHPKTKFAVNPVKDKWHCWHCGAKGKTIFNLVRVLDLRKHEIDELRQLLGNNPKLKVFKENTDKVELRLPYEYTPMWQESNSLEYKHALAYLKKRNISMLDILRYKIGYCETGLYAHRIIIPSYDKDNNLNYFIGRSYFDSNMKYKNPMVSKNIICLENQIDWNSPIILCEGIFDAIAIRQNAIPLLGKHIPKKVQLALFENKVKQVYILLDKDAEGDAINMEQRLVNNGINAQRIIIEGSDASDIGFQQVWEYVKTPQSSSFKDILTTRLSNV
jgi:DNA primase